MSKTQRAVVVTGASSGIGRASTKALIGQGFSVFASVRKSADAQSLRDEFGDAVTPIEFDVTDGEAIAAAAKTVREAIGSDTLAGLVNNAGVAVPGPVMHLPIDDLRQQFEINVFGVIAVTQAFLPLLGASRNPPGPPGRIVNISSISGKLVVPFLGAYAGSKHALEALSDAMRRELMLYGIDVVIVEPGAIKTPIWDKAEAEDVSEYAKTDYASLLEKFQAAMVEQGRNGLEVEEVTRVVLEAMTVDKPRSRYPIPNQQWMGWRIPRLIPDRWLDNRIAQQLGLKRLRK